MKILTEKTNQEFYQALIDNNKKYKDHHNILKTTLLDTPLGTMLAIASEQALYVLDFIDRPSLNRTIEQLRIKTKSTIIPGDTIQTHSIKQELAQYFEGTLKIFNTPLHLLGSPFQQHVWRTLTTVPYGQTCSYAQEAIAMGKPSASRAVANANGVNQLAIIIPCHRIINSNGKLGGYGGGLSRKQWLIDHEKKNTL
jgi:AraC family transcriptional regulator of adaptative response/methylated-DNA-[protein]-cysteine methyltransferase